MFLPVPSVSTSFYCLAFAGSVALVTYIGLLLKETWNLGQYDRLTNWSRSTYPLAQLVLNYSKFKHPLRRKGCSLSKTNNWATRSAFQMKCLVMYDSLKSGRQFHNESLPPKNEYPSQSSISESSTKTWSGKFKHLLRFDVKKRLKQSDLISGVPNNLPLIVALIFGFELDSEIINWIYSALKSSVLKDSEELKVSLMFVLLSESIEPQDPAYYLVDLVQDWKVIVLLNTITRRALNGTLVKHQQFRDFSLNALATSFWQALPLDGYLKLTVHQFAKLLEGKSCEVQAILVMTFVAKNPTVEGTLSLVRPFVTGGYSSYMLPLVIEFIYQSRTLIDALVDELNGNFKNTPSYPFKLGTSDFPSAVPQDSVDFYALLLVPIWDAIRSGTLSSVPADFLQMVFQKSSENARSVTFPILFALLITDQTIFNSLNFPASFLFKKETKLNFFFDSIPFSQYHLFHWILDCTGRTLLLNALVESRRVKMMNLHSCLIEVYTNERAFVDQTARSISLNDLVPINIYQLVLHFFLDIKRAQQDNLPLMEPEYNAIVAQQQYKREFVQFQAEKKILKLSPSVQYMNEYFQTQNVKLLSFGIVVQFMKSINIENINYSKKRTNFVDARFQYLVDLIFQFNEKQLKGYLDDDWYLHFKYFCLYFGIKKGEEVGKVDAASFGFMELWLLNDEKTTNCKFVGKATSEFVVSLRLLVKETFDYKWNSWKGVASLFQRSLSLLTSQPSVSWARLSMVIGKCPDCMAQYLVFLLFDPLVFKNENRLMEIVSRIVKIKNNASAICIALIASAHWSPTFYRLKMFLVTSFLQQLNANSEVWLMSIVLLLYNMSHELSEVKQFEHAYVQLLRLVPVEMLKYLNNVCIMESPKGEFCLLLQNMLRLGIHDGPELMKRFNH